jgi:integrase
MTERPFHIRQYMRWRVVEAKRIALENHPDNPAPDNGMRNTRFNDARERAGVAKELFQFRNLRAKTATEVDETSGTRAAQAILGHTTEEMVAQYIRHKVGLKVRPIR